MRRVFGIFALAAAAGLLLAATWGCAAETGPSRSSAASDDKQVPTTGTESTEASMPPGVTGQADTPQPMPEDTIDAFYAACALKDAARVGRTLVPGYELDPAVLQGWSEVIYTIDTVTSAGEEGSLWIQVGESGGGLPGDVVTFTLLEQPDKAWLISRWDKGTIQDQPGFGADAVFIPAKEASATQSLATMLQWRMSGDLTSMRSYATADMQKRQPDIFTIHLGEFTAFESRRVWEEDGAWVFEVRETWKSGVKTYEYVVVNQGGKWLVNERR